MPVNTILTNQHINHPFANLGIIPHNITHASSDNPVPRVYIHVSLEVALAC